MFSTSLKNSFFAIFAVAINREGNNKTNTIMNNIMDFWRNEWEAVADTSEVTGIDDVELFSGSIINNSNHVVYYKPEKGSYDEKNRIAPHSSKKVNADGIATCLHRDKVFKIPGQPPYHPDVNVDISGQVSFRFFNQWPADLYSYYRQKVFDEKYEYGWMTLEELDDSWQTLFDLAKEI